MKFVRNIFMLLVGVWVVCAAVRVNGGTDSKPAMAVAGMYEGESAIEILQMKLKLKLELKPVHKDSVVVVVKDFVLPTGQKFNYRSQPIAVKGLRKDGKTLYDLNTSFNYDYNGMPMAVTAHGEIEGDSLRSEVKATIMGAMETKVQYKAKRLSR